MLLCTVIGYRYFPFGEGLLWPSSVTSLPPKLADREWSAHVSKHLFLINCDKKGNDAAAECEAEGQAGAGKGVLQGHGNRTVVDCSVMFGKDVFSKRTELGGICSMIVRLTSK